MKPDCLIEVPLETIMFVPKGRGRWSLLIVDHPIAGPQALWFNGDKLDRVDDLKEEVETYEEAVRLVYDGFSEANFQRVYEEMGLGG